LVTGVELTHQRYDAEGAIYQNATGHPQTSNEEGESLTMLERKRKPLLFGIQLPNKTGAWYFEV
jgi:hypothetical protein